MRIALNALYVGQGVAGGRVYCEGLLKGFAALEDDTEFTVFARRDIAFPELPARFKIETAPISPESTLRRTLWEYLALPRRLHSGGFDIFHALGSVSPSPPRKIKFVLTVHDLIYRHFPASMPFGHRWFTRLVQSGVALKAHRIIVPSRASRDDVIRFLHVDPERIRIVPYGSGNDFQPIDDAVRIEEALAKFGVRKPYILSVARGYPHKNLAGLLRAFARFPSLGLKDAQLVLVGDRYLVGRELDRLIDELGIRASVVFTGFATNHQLNSLYCGAAVFAFPSLSEGLGLPVVEAMACGLPVVASKASAVPEAVGDAGVLADATNPDEFAAAIVGVLHDDKKKAELRDRGFRQAKQFDWVSSARKLLEVYRELDDSR